MTEKNLEQLTNKVRQAIPRLMEATTGCLIQSKYYGIAPMIFYDSEYYEYTFVDELLLYRKCNEKDITIIGHEPMINDVLEWLGDKYSIDNDGNLYKYDIDKFQWVYKMRFWDLSKPYLKDQSKELINYLNELKKC